MTNTRNDNPYKPSTVQSVTFIDAPSAYTVALLDQQLFRHDRDCSRLVSSDGTANSCSDEFFFLNNLETKVSFSDLQFSSALRCMSLISPH